jgi:spore coat protein U-like protein
MIRNRCCQIETDFRLAIPKYPGGRVKCCHRETILRKQTLSPMRESAKNASRMADPTMHIHLFQSCERTAKYGALIKNRIVPSTFHKRCATSQETKLSYTSRISRSILTLSLLAASALSASAATSTSTFQVTATVQSVCQISAGNLNFGNYAGTQLASTSTVTVSCTQNQAYDVGLNGGSNSLPVTDRKMTGPGGTVLSYGLYSDNNHSANWGNTVGTDTVRRNGNGNAQTLTIYGRLPANQLVQPGAYSDTITATITY